MSGKLRSVFRKKSNDHKAQKVDDSRQKMLRNLFSPYKEMFGWLNSFTINFLKRDTSSLLSSLPVESTLAVIDNLAPEQVERNVRDKAGPFYFQGNNVGIILVHGFCSTAQEMQDLGEYLNKERGFSTFGVLLAGHGTSPADLAQTDMIDWYKSLKEAYDFMKESCEKIILIGHSMGGTLSFLLAANKQVDGIVSLCTPIKVEYFMQDYLFLVSDLLKYFPRRKAEIEIMDKNDLINYRVSSLKAVENLLDLMEIAREEITKVSSPIFTITAGQDERVPLYNAERIHQLVKSKIKKDYLATNSNHTILFDSAKEDIKARILEFIDELME